ncbi:MAG: amidohydrolase family protein [Patescibacteria group bacterium]
MIIDSHVHISYFEDNKTLADAKNQLLLEMRKNKIDKAVVIPDNQPNPKCAGLDKAIQLTKNEPKLYVIGTLNILKITDSDLKKIDNLFKQKIIKGFKIFPGHDPIYPTDKRLDKIYKLCIKYELPLIIHTGINTGDTACAKYNDPKHIIKVAKKYLKLKIIIAHYFWPKLDYCYKTTDGFKNIYFDTSGLADPEVVRDSGGIKKIRKILEQTVARNPESVIFGTDWPMCDVKKHIKLIISLKIKKIEKEKIFCSNAQKVFGLK